MKKKLFSLTICLSAAFIWSCNNTSSTTASGDSTTTANSADTMGNTATPNTSTVTSTPLSKDDSSFVMEAAKGGMMEVQAGQVAQQNAQSQRVKDFGNMMVNDHSKANDELKSLVSGRLTLPDSLSAADQKHITAMQKMKGTAFDKHYISMMVEDHQKDVAKFKKASANCNDAQLKSWAATTLPVLQKHLDSIQAIKKGM